jgi:hypothetical protein
MQCSIIKSLTRKLQWRLSEHWGPIWGPATSRGILEPTERQNDDNVVRGNPKGWTFYKRHRAQPNCNNGIKDWGLKQQLWLGSKWNVNKALRRIIVLEVIKLAEVFHQDSKNKCQNVAEELATTQVKEETTHSWRARDVGTPATFGSSACTDRKRKNANTPVGYFGRAALRREKCGMSTESQNSLIIKGSHY